MLIRKQMLKQQTQKKVDLVVYIAFYSNIQSFADETFEFCPQSTHAVFTNVNVLCLLIL